MLSAEGVIATGVTLVSVMVRVVSLGQLGLGGTQPNELDRPPEPSSTCSCHQSFTQDAFSEPGQSYRATTMALSGRDPLFRAAFEVARQDAPELTELCLRCHTPAAWLQDRSKGELSALTEADLEGVTCDICHRMIEPDAPLIGNGQVTLSRSTAKRGPRGNSPFNGHGVVRDDYLTSAQMCGTCHSLFNPLETAHGADDQPLDTVYFEQRTFEEWRDSALPGRGQTCISCHMKVTRGASTEGGPVYDDLPIHNFVGGNDFAPRAAQVINPQLNLALELGQVSRWVEESLASAAELEILSSPTEVVAGESFELQVRLTNRTGHKLPTGYPEGRRVYLRVALELQGDNREVVLSGDWDPATGILIPDPQLRTYETEHGRVEGGRSFRTRRLLLMNQVRKDTRLPPEGFVPAHADMIPSGRDYGSPPYRHYDEVRYAFDAPAVSGPTNAVLTVSAMYQSTDGEVVDFLVNAAAGTPSATELARAWQVLRRAPPKEMTRRTVNFAIRPQIVARDAGIVDTGSPSDPPEPTVAAEAPANGCRCASGPTGTRLAWSVLLFGIVTFAHRSFGGRSRGWRSRRHRNGHR